MLWTSSGMQMWSFERNAIPPFISNRSSTPLLSEFGAPVASFQGSCDFDAHFTNQQMIFNTDFCGSNAGDTFQMHGCPMVSDCAICVSCTQGELTDICARPQASHGSPVTSTLPITRRRSWSRTGRSTIWRCMRSLEKWSCRKHSLPVLRTCMQEQLGRPCGPHPLPLRQQRRKGLEGGDFGAFSMGLDVSLMILSRVESSNTKCTRRCQQHWSFLPSILGR
jgi:hypothetical protein